MLRLQSLTARFFYAEIVLLVCSNEFVGPQFVSFTFGSASCNILKCLVIGLLGFENNLWELVINLPNSKQVLFCNCKAVWKGNWIEKAHMIDFLKIHIAIQQLLIATVNNYWPVWCCKNMCCVLRAKGPQGDSFCTQQNLLPVRQLSSAHIQYEVE